SDQMALQNMMERARAQSQGYQGAIESGLLAQRGQQALNLAETENYTPINVQGLHPAVAQYVQSIGQQMPDGTYRVHNQLVPGISQFQQQQQQRSQSLGTQQSLRNGLLQMVKDPETGLPRADTPRGVQALIATLGSDQPVDPKLIDQAIHLMQV